MLSDFYTHLFIRDGTLTMKKTAHWPSRITGLLHHQTVTMTRPQELHIQNLNVTTRFICWKLGSQGGTVGRWCESLESETSWKVGSARSAGEKGTLKSEALVSYHDRTVLKSDSVLSSTSLASCLRYGNLIPHIVLQLPYTMMGLSWEGPYQSWANASVTPFTFQNCELNELPFLVSNLSCFIIAMKS